MTYVGRNLTHFHHDHPMRILTQSPSVIRVSMYLGSAKTLKQLTYIYVESDGTGDEWIPLLNWYQVATNGRDRVLLSKPQQ